MVLVHIRKIYSLTLTSSHGMGDGKVSRPCALCLILETLKNGGDIIDPVEPIASVPQEDTPEPVSNLEDILAPSFINTEPISPLLC